MADSKPWERNWSASSPKPWDRRWKGDQEAGKQLVQGFNEGLFGILRAAGDIPSNIMEYPAAAVTSVLRQEPLAKSMERGRANIEKSKQFEKETFYPDEPAAGIPSIVRRTGVELGRNVPFAGIPLAAAPAFQGARQVGTLSERVIQQLLQSISRSPGKATIGEVVATAGSGAGAGVAEQVAPGSQTAEMVGQLAGGLTPTAAMVAPGMLMAKVGTKIGGRILESTLGAIPKESLPALLATIRKIPVAGKPAAALVGKAAEKGARIAQESARSVVSTQAKKVIGPEEHGNITAAMILEDKVPDLRIPLAAATKQPDLLATHFDIQRYMTPQERAALGMRLRRNERAVTTFAVKNRPDSDLAPDYVVDVANGKLTALRDEAANISGKIAGEAESLAAALPRVNKADVGANLRGIQEKIYIQRMNEMKELKKALGLENVDITTPFDDWRNAMIAKYGDPVGELKKIPDVESALMRIGRPNVAEKMARVGGEPQPAKITWENLEKLDQELYDMWQSARAGSNPNYGKARVIAEIRKDVQGFMDSLDGQLGEAYKQFKNTYREQIIVPFREGAAFQVTEKNARNFYRTYDEEVADTYFGAGEISAARKFKQVFGANPEAARAYENIALDDLRASAVVDGIIDPKKLDRWVAKHQTVLDEFPDLQDRVSSIVSANNSLLDRQTQIIGRVRQLEDDRLTKILGKVTTEDMTPEQAIARIVKDSRLTNRIWQMLDEPGKAALGRHIWDSVIDAPAANVAGFIDTNAGSLQVIFGEKGLSNLRTLVSAKEAIELSGGVAGRAFEPNPLVDVERQLGMGVPQLGSRIFAFKSGRMQKGYLILDVLSRFVRGHSQIDLENAWKQAMFDKQLAADLSDVAVTKAFDSPAAKRLKTRFFLLGYGGEEEEAAPIQVPATDTIRTNWLGAR